MPPLLVRAHTLHEREAWRLFLVIQPARLEPGWKLNLRTRVRKGNKVEVGGYVRPPKSKFAILTNSTVLSDQK